MSRTTRTHAWVSGSRRANRPQIRPTADSNLARHRSGWSCSGGQSRLVGIEWIPWELWTFFSPQLYYSLLRLRSGMFGREGSTIRDSGRSFQARQAHTHGRHAFLLSPPSLLLYSPGRCLGCAGEWH